MPNISSLNNNGAITATSGSVKYRQNQSVPLSHNDVDSNFENLRLKLNTVITDTNALTNGDYNLSGPQGTQGLTGSQGAQGRQGLQGRQGTTGLQGTTGSQGTQGRQGLQGRQGIIGSQGTTGGQGTQGRQGLTGTGTQGTQGRQGLQGTSGAGASGDISATEIAFSSHGTDLLAEYTASQRSSLIGSSNKTIMQNSASGGVGIWTIGDSSGEYCTNFTINISPSGSGVKNSVILYEPKSSGSTTSKMWYEYATQMQAMSGGGTERGALTLWEIGEAGRSGESMAVSNLLHTGTSISCYSTFVGSSSLGEVTLGTSSVRWGQIYSSSSTVSTSDKRLKQDVEEISEAEKRVAVVAKGLLKKYRWIDRVEEKGEDARIHFGVMAQDLISAFEAEGLDATRYGLFCYDEWWTNPEDKSETDTKARDGWIRHDRYSVRYEELFAFIISAL